MRQNELPLKLISMHFLLQQYALLYHESVNKNVLAEKFLFYLIPLTKQSVLTPRVTFFTTFRLT